VNNGKTLSLSALHKYFKIMPDIIMCNNQDCPLSYSCWRFNCPPSQHQQSYQKFEPQIDEVLGEVECKMYLETPNSENSDIVRLFG
jgi:hypothetical protein